MSRRPFNVLFLCTGNSARSIVAETLLNHMANDRFKAFSAGSHPSGTVNPLVLEFLNDKGISTSGARSKPWEEFSAPGAPEMHFVITVCDQAAGETCPIWPGHPVTAHWGVEDPALHMNDAAKAKKVIDDAFNILRARILLLLSLPVEKLDSLALQSKTREIGQRK
jgi:protein-tyrosine-phosphatase